MSNTSKTNTANIVVSYINRPIKEIIRFVNSGARTNDSYLFRLSNDNILKFSHSYNFNKSDGDDIGSKITLETVDVEGVFENVLFGNAMELGYSADVLEELRQKTLNEIIRRTEIRAKLDGFTFAGFTDINRLGLKPFKATFGDKVEFEFGRLVTNTDLVEELKQTLVKIDGGDKLAEEIVSKLIQKGRYRKIDNPNPRFGTTVRPQDVEVIAETSLSAIFDDFSLNNTDTSVLPTPYFYFYYGSNDNPYAWSGPIAAQMVNAKYNYSVENGKKSIELEFATTYNFPAFSKLALDKRGFSVTVPPEPVAAQVLSPTAVYQVGFLNNYVRGVVPLDGITPDGTHLAIKNVITDYIRRVTDPSVNVLVLLPNINDIIKKVLIDYYKEFTIAEVDQWEIESNKTHAFLRFFQDLGFKVNLLTPPDIDNPPKDLRSLLGAKVQLKTKLSTDALPQQESSVAEHYEKMSNLNGAYFNDIVLTLSLSKDFKESFRKPLDRIIAGMSDKLSPIQPCLEIIDNLEFVNEFYNYLRFRKLDIYYDIRPNKPIVVFGDRFIIEKYLYGKKFYELQEILERRTTTKEKDLAEGLSLADRLKKYAKETKDSGDYLEKFDKRLFLGDKNSYIIDIASKYFLRIDTTRDGFSYENNFYVPPRGEFQLPSKAEENLLKSRIPIFKSGITESNILNLDLNLNDYYFATLKSVWQSKDTLNLQVDSNIQVDVSSLTAFDTSTLDTMVDSLQNLNLPATAQLRLESVFQFLQKDSKFNNPALTATEKSNQMYLLITFLAKELERIKSPNQNSNTNAKGLTVIVGSHESVNPYIQYLNMFTRVVNNAFVGYVKTLPMFYLTGTAFSLPPVALLIEETNVPPYERRNFITRTFNGLWSILGFKHTITKDEMSSEFWIVKDIRLEIPLIIQKGAK